MMSSQALLHLGERAVWFGGGVLLKGALLLALTALAGAALAALVGVAAPPGLDAGARGRGDRLGGGLAAAVLDGGSELDAGCASGVRHRGRARVRSFEYVAGRRSVGRRAIRWRRPRPRVALAALVAAGAGRGVGAGGALALLVRLALDLRAARGLARRAAARLRRAPAGAAARHRRRAGGHPPARAARVVGDRRPGHRSGCWRPVILLPRARRRLEPSSSCGACWRTSWPTPGAATARRSSWPGSCAPSTGPTRWPGGRRAACSPSARWPPTTPPSATGARLGLRRAACSPGAGGRVGAARPAGRAAHDGRVAAGRADRAACSIRSAAGRRRLAPRAGLGTGGLLALGAGAGVPGRRGAAGAGAGRPRTGGPCRRPTPDRQSKLWVAIAHLDRASCGRRLAEADRERGPGQRHPAAEVHLEAGRRGDRCRPSTWRDRRQPCARWWPGSWRRRPPAPVRRCSSMPCRAVGRGPSWWI